MKFLASALRKQLFPLALIPLIFFSLIPSACNNPATAKLEPIEEVEYYDYAVTYIRTAIVRPGPFDPESFVCHVPMEHKTSPRKYPLTKLNDYKFTGGIYYLPTHVKADEPLNAIEILDQKRWEEEWIEGIYCYGRPYTVGDIIILKNMKTGFEKKLENIVNNPYWGDILPAKCDPKMATFKTIKGGIILDK